MGIIYLILKRDFHALPRHKWFYYKRAMVVGIMGFIIVLNAYHFGNTMSLSTAGLRLFSQISFASLFLLTFMPYMVASEFNDELENNTLGLLLMSNVPVFFALVSRLLSNFFNGLFALVSLLPLLILCVSLGGISFGQIVGTVIILLSTLVFTVCFGCFCSVCGAGGKKTMRFVWIGVLFYLCYPMISKEIWEYFYTYSSGSLHDNYNIFSYFAMQINLNINIFDSPDDLATIIFSCFLHLLMAIFFLCIAWFLLPNVLSGDGRKGTVKTARPKKEKWKNPIAFDQRNPIYVLDFYKNSGGWKHTIIKLGILTFVILIFCLISAYSWETALISTALILSIMLFYLSISRAGNIFSRERKSGGFQILLSTILEEKDFVRGKIKALVCLYLPMVTMIISFLILFLYVEFSPNTGLFALGLIFLFIFFVIISFYKPMFISVCIFIVGLLLLNLMDNVTRLNRLDFGDLFVVSMYIFFLIGIWLMLCTFGFLYALKIGRFGLVLMPIIATVYVFTLITIMGILINGLGFYSEVFYGTLFCILGVLHLIVTGIVLRYITINFRKFALAKEDL